LTPLKGTRSWCFSVLEFFCGHRRSGLLSSGAIVFPDSPFPPRLQGRREHPLLRFTVLLHDASDISPGIFKNEKLILSLLIDAPLLLPEYDLAPFSGVDTDTL